MPAIKDSGKKPVYIKPKLRIIELVADEVLAAGCKTASGGGPAPPTCLTSPCADDGS